MPTAYFLIGPSGCGKSTWRKKNADLLDAVVISSDDIYEEIAAASRCTYTEAVQRIDYETVIVPKVKAAITRAVLEKRNIILDQTNVSVGLRMRFRHLLPVKYEVVAVVFEFDPMEIRQRVLERGRATGKVIPESAITVQLATYMAPKKWEFAKIITVPRNQEG